jgi:hypothetical protein
MNCALNLIALTALVVLAASSPVGEYGDEPSVKTSYYWHHRYPNTAESEADAKAYGRHAFTETETNVHVDPHKALADAHSFAKGGKSKAQADADAKAFGHNAHVDTDTFSAAGPHGAVSGSASQATSGY